MTSGESTVVRDSAGDVRWWTFAGAATNATVLSCLTVAASESDSSDNLSIALNASASSEELQKALDELREMDADRLHPRVDETALDGLKFSECLPREVAISTLARRIVSQASAAQLLGQRVRFVVL